jgi:hypothetical protein
VAVRAQPVRKPELQRDTATPLEKAGSESGLRKSGFFRRGAPEKFFGAWHRFF